MRRAELRDQPLFDRFPVYSALEALLGIVRAVLTLFAAPILHILAARHTDRPSLIDDAGLLVIPPGERSSACYLVVVLVRGEPEWIFLIPTLAGCRV